MSPAASGREDDDRVAEQAAVLGDAKGKDVDTGLPGGLRGRATQPRHGIGEAGAVHVNLQPVRVGDVAHGGHFVHRVDGAEVGRLRRGSPRPAGSCARGPCPRSRSRPPALAGSSLPCGPATGTSLVPPPKKPVALHSEVLTCASGCNTPRRTAWPSAASASALAAVPVATGKTRTWPRTGPRNAPAASPSADRRRSRGPCPVLAATSASISSGAARPQLSLRKSIGVFMGRIRGWLAWAYDWNQLLTSLERRAEVEQAVAALGAARHALAQHGAGALERRQRRLAPGRVVKVDEARLLARGDLVAQIHQRFEQTRTRAHRRSSPRRVPAGGASAGPA